MCRVHNVIGEGTVNWWGREELHIGAEIVLTVFARSAEGAADAGLKGNAITGQQSGHLTTNLFNDTSTFMTNYHGFFHYIISTFEVLEIVNITAAYANSFYFDSNIMGSKRRELERLNLEGIDAHKPSSHVLFYFYISFSSTALI
jgi:hypothetical protein